MPVFQFWCFQVIIEWEISFSKALYIPIPHPVVIYIDENENFFKHLLSLTIMSIRMKLMGKYLTRYAWQKPVHCSE